MPETCPSELTRDQFMGGKVFINQPKIGYRAGSDPVFLAAAVSGDTGQSVLDLGCGVGTAGVCLLARITGMRGVGLELQADLAALARTNVVDNGLADRLTVVEGRLQARPLELRGRSFDHVMTNPPWFEAGRGTPPPVPGKAIAHQEDEVDLPAWIRMAAKYLKPGGWLWVIHRADRLDVLLAGMDRARLGDARIFPLWSKVGKPAVRVIAAGRKNSRAPMRLLPGLVVHDEDGGYSLRAEAVLRGGEGLDGLL